MAELSGTVWVSRFPTSSNTSDLLPGFRKNIDKFIAALHAGGANVNISATFRPPERAYLMHYAWRIAKEGLSASGIPAMAGVDIEWDHGDAGKSRIAANKMVVGYGIVFAPALSSHHSLQRAIDMTITDHVGKIFEDGTGKQVKVATAAQLHALGKTYDVYKLASDPPHWSDDGH